MLASVSRTKTNTASTSNEAVVGDDTTAQSNASTSFWLDAHFDPVANLKTFSTCLHSCDLYGDGDWRLAVAGLDKKLKVGLFAVQIKSASAFCQFVTVSQLAFRFGKARSWLQSMLCLIFLALWQASTLMRKARAFQLLLWLLVPMYSSTATSGPTSSSHCLWM